VDDDDSLSFTISSPPGLLAQTQPRIFKVVLETFMKFNLLEIINSVTGRGREGGIKNTHIFRNS